MDEIKIDKDEYIAELESQMLDLHRMVMQQNIVIRKLQSGGESEDVPQG